VLNEEMSTLFRKQLTDHVYAAEQTRTGTGWSNSGLVAAGGGLVIDSLYDVKLTRELAALYAEVFPSAPTTVVNTHHNGDHCWGNQVFAGAEIIAHTGCAKRFSDFTPERAEMIRTMTDPPESMRLIHEEWADFDFSEVVLTPPTTVLETDQVLDLGGVRVDLLYVGPAHTEGDLIVHVPDEGVVLMGDVLFNKCAPIGWEGSTENWITALRRVEDLEPQFVVPGHGPVCGLDGLREARSYFEAVQSHARQSWSEGRSVLDCCAGIDLGPWVTWDEPWRLAANVHRVYRECEGASWDTAFDASVVMADVEELRRRLEG
jgi:glyoxylase-like metal-dependent hydrolase (beta-lactamase superfamily II)